MGRLTRDPDIRYSQGENAMEIARYTLAVGRRTRRDANSEQTADFISCVAFGKIAEFAESKNSASEGGSYVSSRPEPVNAAGDGFMNIPDGVEDEGLPFN